MSEDKPKVKSALEAVQESRAHWKRMITWVEGLTHMARMQNMRNFLRYTTMVGELGEAWSADYCPLCQFVFRNGMDCGRCPVVVEGGVQCDGDCDEGGEYGSSSSYFNKVTRARNWQEWLVAAREISVALGLLEECVKARRREP